jgi:glutathione S-transferase
MIMKLYGYPPSPNTWKVRAVASHVGQPLDLQFVDLLKGEHRKPDYLALNPTGRTPTLVDGDFVLWESNAITQYIADRKSSTLWPNDARTRADIARWQSWQLQHWSGEACQPLTFQRLVKKFFNMGPPDATVVEKATEAFNREARVLDAHFARQAYVVGDALTIADFAVVAALLYHKEAELPLAPYGHLRNWFDRVSALPAWRETAPQIAAAA